MTSSKNTIPTATPSTIPHPVQASIDVVLTGLRETEPSPGLERRLLETLAAHPGSSVHPNRRWPWLPSTPHHHLRPRAAIASALAAVLVVTAALLHQHHQPVPTTPAATPSPATPSRSSIAAVPSSVVTHHICCHSERSEEPPRLVLSHEAQRRPPATHTQPLHLASYPAPPMPLTDQEKLLLRVAHSANPQHSTVLNPNLQARAEAASATEFQLFFVDATTIHNPEPPPD